MRRPLIVEETERGFAAARRRLLQSGHVVVDEWRNETGVVCAGVVADADDAGRALLAAVWGAGLVLRATARREVIERLVEDLRRFGHVDYCVGGEHDEIALTHDELALLRFIADGGTLGAAARELHVSRRTADRRLASAKAKLGVSTTAEAVVALATRASGS